MAIGIKNRISARKFCRLKQIFYNNSEENEQILKIACSYELMISCWRLYPEARPCFNDLDQKISDILSDASAN